jgi:hypothetical protein
MSSPLSDSMEQILDRFDEAWNGRTPWNASRQSMGSAIPQETMKPTARSCHRSGR